MSNKIYIVSTKIILKTHYESKIISASHNIDQAKITMLNFAKNRYNTEDVKFISSLEQTSKTTIFTYKIGNEEKYIEFTLIEITEGQDNDITISVGQI